MRARPLTALRFDALAWAYEPIAMRLCRAAAWRPALVAAIDPRPGERILDLGCGPATVCRLVERACPSAVVVGVEPDPVMRERARRAGIARRSRVRIVAASATALPTDHPFDTPFDACTASLMFHHLLPDDKVSALGEALRVLRPGGRLVVADWGPPRTAAGRAAFAVTRLFDGFAVTRDHADGSFARRLGAHVADLGERGRWATPVGTLCLYVGRKPSPV